MNTFFTLLLITARLGSVSDIKNRACISSNGSTREVLLLANVLSSVILVVKRHHNKMSEGEV